MSSPFLKVPESEWVASNAWAFALRDRDPVSPGHTLVIPRRLVATWFEATPEEQRALFALVDEVKRALDASEPRPDGYNVGFNVGEAAGQTVFHLHVHVIPRSRGDMEDPRGGVRHVIPSKGVPRGEPPAARLPEALTTLHRWSREQRHAPHKPLLLLLMLARIQRLWRLENDGRWDVVGDNPSAWVSRKGNTDPARTSLRSANARGGFLEEDDAPLHEDPLLLRQAVQLPPGLFPKERHQTLIDETGLRLD